MTIERSAALAVDLDKKKEPELEIEVEGEEPEAKEPPAKKKAKEKEVDIEVVDDTPEADRGRKKSKAPEELTEEELESYSEKVRKRVQHFSKGYHDERREKEAALRERDELQNTAKRLLDEVNQLKGAVTKNQTAVVEQAKQTVTAELANARKEYEEAYESGDAKKVLAAQEKLVAATIKADKVNNFRVTPVQETKKPVKEDSPAPALDPKVEAWVKRNPWFHRNQAMTGFALGLHSELVAEGVTANSDAYYRELDARLRDTFPKFFEEDDGEEDEVKPQPKRKADAVAPASRSTASKKITLTKTEAAVARKLGVPLEEYAKQKAALERN